jgi:hypothetical protein
MSDRSFGLFEPDALLPAQFYAAFRGGSAVRGEKRLMLAVLQDALDCYQKYAFAKDPPGQQLFSEADSWITCDDRNWYFSFENICETLEISPDYLRHGVVRWKSSASLLPTQKETAPASTGNQPAETGGQPADTGNQMVA